MKKENKTKALIYGGNFVAGVIGNTVGTKIGNPFGAIVYTVLDITSHFSDKVRTSKYTRLAKALGGAFYGVSSIIDIFGIAGGEMGNLIQLPFDASMAYQLGKDTFDNYYNYRGKSIVADVKRTIEDVKGLVGKLE